MSQSSAPRVGWGSPLRLQDSVTRSRSAFLAVAIVAVVGASGLTEDATAVAPNDAFDRLSRVSAKRLGADFGCLVLNINRNVELKVVSRRGREEAKALVREMHLAKVTRVRVVNRRYAHSSIKRIFTQTRASLEQMPADQATQYTVSISDSASRRRCPAVNVKGPKTGSSPESVGWIRGLQSIFGSDRLTFTQVDPPPVGL